MTILFQDSGVGTDASPIAGNWTVTGVAGPIRRISNEFATTSPGTDSDAYVNSFVMPDDGYAQAVISVLGTGDGGPKIRMSVFGDGYFPTSFSGQIHLFRIRASGVTYEEIGTPVAGSFALNDVVQIRAVGTTISIYQNAVLKLTTTDSMFATGKAGIHMFDGTLRYKLFEAGDFTSGPAFLPGRQNVPHPLLVR